LASVTNCIFVGRIGQLLHPGEIFLSRLRDCGFAPEIPLRQTSLQMSFAHEDSGDAFFPRQTAVVFAT
jgi:hypothetical protein